MKQLVRTELLKLRTTRTILLGAASSPLIAVLVTVAVYGGAGKQGNEPLGAHSLVQAVGAPASVITFVALLLGVLGMAGEYRHQTITTTFLATPRRGHVVAAKLVAHALLGAAMGLASLVVTFALAIPWLRSADVAVRVDGDVLQVAVGLAVSSALYGALGVSLGALIRNQSAAITAVIVWLLAAEGILGDLFGGSGFLRWLPVATGRALVQAGRSDALLAAPVAALAFLAYVAAFAAAAAHLTLHRDVT